MPILIKIGSLTLAWYKSFASSWNTTENDDAPIPCWRWVFLLINFLFPLCKYRLYISYFVNSMINLHWLTEWARPWTWNNDASILSSRSALYWEAICPLDLTNSVLQNFPFVRMYHPYIQTVRIRHFYVQKFLGTYHFAGHLIRKLPWDHQTFWRDHEFRCWDLNDEKLLSLYEWRFHFLATFFHCIIFIRLCK